MSDVMTTRKQREKMEHAIGLAACKGTRNKAKPGWRNYYCTDQNDADWNALVAMGLAVQSGTNGGDSVYFHVTSAGYAELGLKPPRAERE